MNEEIRNILDGVKDSEKVLAYIESLEEHLHHHHHHDDDCDCGCHDDEEDEWKEVKTSYKNKMRVKNWEKLLKDKNIFTKDSLIVLKRMSYCRSDNINGTCRYIRLRSRVLFFGDG